MQLVQEQQEQQEPLQHLEQLEQLELQIIHHMEANIKTIFQTVIF
jgi:hypothetical protein